MTGATEGVDYTLEYYATGGPTINGQDLTGYTVLTMGPFGPTLEIADNSVDENPAPGAAAGPLSVANTNATFTYSLVDGEGDSGNDYFTLDGSGPNNSNLLTDAVFDYETTNSYSIRVLAEQDGGGLSLTNKLTIDITDVVGEDGGFMYARGEVATDRTLVGTLEAELADGDSSVTYTRDAATYHGAMFQISDATNLVLNVAARPARARPHVGQAGSQPPSRFPLRSTSSQWPLLADPTRCSNPLLFRIARLLSIDVVLIPVAVAIARLDIRGFAPINCSIFC
jgi:hypothetical protein